MAKRGLCGECGHDWILDKEPSEYSDGPRCSQCGERQKIAVEDVGPGFDPAAAVGADGGDGRVDDLSEALRATPGVGDAGISYATYWFSNGEDDAESLHDVLLEVDGVGTQAARRIVESVLGESETPDGAAPFTLDGGGDGGDDEDFIDKLAKAQRAGLIGEGRDNSGMEAEAVAQAVSEAMAPVVKQMAQNQQMLTESRQDGDSELEELREEIEELRNEREREELRQLEEKIERLERDGGPDEDIARLRETREMLENAPEISAEAADSWGSLAHGLIDRLKSAERQRAMLGAPGADARQPSHAPRVPGQGHPRQPSPGVGEQAGQQRPASATDGGQTDVNEQAPAGDDTDDDTADDAADDAADGDENAVSDVEQKGRQIRQRLGLSGGESA
jgi:hypothetical protein